jgi:hypothetical protein
VSTRLDVDYTNAPAAVRWMGEHELTIAALLRDPDDRDVRLAAYPAVLVRGGRRIFTPPLDLPLVENDSLLLLGRDEDLQVVRATVFHDSAVEYVVTGREVATAWFFRVVQRVRWRLRAR